MEKKTIAKAATSVVIAAAGLLCALGIGRGGSTTYQLPGPYTAESTNDFSTVQVAMTIQDEQITDCEITSSGDSDLLTDALRAEWAQSIVDNQSAENDVISGATLTYSAASVKEAAADIFQQAGLPVPEPVETPEPEAPEEEPEEAEPTEEAASTAEAAAEGGLTDGTYTAEKTNDFSTVAVEATVEGGRITAATVSSDGGATDLLTDELRQQWGDAIVEAQSADADAITGATLTFSAGSVKEAVDDILAQAQGGSGESGEDDARIAELEAALAEAEARAEEAETRAEEAEAKVEALEAAAAAEEAPAEAESGDISAYTRPRPATGDAAEAETEDAPAEGESGDISAYTRPRPVTGDAAEAETEDAPAEGESGDISAYTRPRPVTGDAVEAEEAPAEAESGDISAYTRPRPVTGAAAEAETKEAPAEAESGDISAYTRPRPATGDAVEAEDAADTAEALTEEQRLASILPNIVTSMGDNRENSYVIDYLEQDPYLVNIYEGYGFAKDYGSARGHEYTLEDVAKTQRPHPKANCITCKTPDLHKMIEEQGVAVYSMPFAEVFPQMTNNISCYTCHGDDLGNGGALKVTHQYVNEALGENVSAIAPATLSCGQCHIEYYFTPEDSETMMPYHSVEEMTPQAILDYYDALGFSDWTQESTGTAMLKAQHPEMETFLQGKHAAFLTCADCHMAPETTGDGVAYRSHTLVSPLESEALLASCAQCHGDTDMVDFVHGIQESVTARETEVGNALSDMKDALAAAVASGDWSEDDLNAVRKLHREAQWFFDYCYVENSEGAHNSQLSLSCLDTSEEKIEEAMRLLDSHTT